MKKSFMLYIIACMSSFFLFVSCEQSELQTTPKADTTIPITTRSAIEECEDCPIGYCCGAIELLQSGMYTIQFCGVYTGMSGTPCGPFSAGSPCSTISGSSSSIMLDGMGDRMLFCVPTDGSFRIYYSGTGTVDVRITTDYDVVNPDWEYVELDSSTPAYFYADENCSLTEC